MTADFSENSLVLTDAAAREWYMTRRGGGNLLDAHLGALHQHLGPDISYALRAPIDPLTGRPSLLIIEVDLSVSEDASWESLSTIESDLLNQRDRLAQIARRKDPFANIVITLTARSEEWDAVHQAIEDME
jgi:hypothetical protein